jgi:hypothetical protein
VCAWGACACAWCLRDRERTSSSAHDCTAARRNANQAGVCTNLVKHTGRSNRRDVRLDEDPAQCGDCQHTSDPDGATEKFGHGCRTLHFRFVKEHTDTRTWQWGSAGSVHCRVPADVDLGSVEISTRLLGSRWLRVLAEDTQQHHPYKSQVKSSQDSTQHFFSYSSQVDSIIFEFIAAQGWPRQWWWWWCWQRCPL